MSQDNVIIKTNARQIRHSASGAGMTVLFVNRFYNNIILSVALKFLS